MHAHRLDPATVTIDPRLDRGLRQLLLIGVAAVLLLPSARGYSTWLGWMPLWLLGMPLAGWWALHRFRLPRWPQALRLRSGLRGRQSGRVQAGRRNPAPRIRFARAGSAEQVLHTHGASSARRMR